MREGSLDAPIRHPVDWKNPEFTDKNALDAELRRVFDICHGCRRCFNLCDSFPRLFDLIDESETMELDSVDSKDFKPVVDACTLCDLCFMTKCPYVPPHEFNLDFPHLMLRYRATEFQEGKTPFVETQLTETDRNGQLARPLSRLINWATDRGNGITRPVMEAVAGIHHEAELPKFRGQTLELLDKSLPGEANAQAPAFGKRKAVLYATCYGNFNKTEIGLAARDVLHKIGVETVVTHPACCGMPKLEKGDIEAVVKHANQIKKKLLPFVDEGFDIVALVPSCALMLKFEWPLLMPEDEDIKKLAQATFDTSEYVVNVAKTEGVPEGLQSLDSVTVHLACHARAQNMGAKAVEMLNLVPDTKIEVIERCSGHGGSWGLMKDNFEVALKVGKPVARTALKNQSAYLASECPLAADHIVQGLEKLEPATKPKKALHPIELFAKAYGLEGA